MQRPKFTELDLKGNRLRTRASKRRSPRRLIPFRKGAAPWQGTKPILSQRTPLKPWRNPVILSAGVLGSAAAITAAALLGLADSPPSKPDAQAPESTGSSSTSTPAAAQHPADQGGGDAAGSGAEWQPLALPLANTGQPRSPVPPLESPRLNRTPLPDYTPEAEPPAEDETSEAEPPTEEDPARQHEVVEVRSGDSLARIFRRNGLSAADVHHVLNAGQPAERLASLQPGQRLTLIKDSEGALQGLRLPFSAEEALRIEADGDGGFQASVVPRQSQRELVKTEAEIERSLYRAADRAGLNTRLTMDLIRILDWEIDLGRDLRAGDSFTVIFERIEVEDETMIGDIKAVRLDSDRAGTIEAIRYSHGDGQADYYTPQGESLRREFMRYPVNYRRISSSFDRNRRHPILGTHRPHLGVDLAAPRGTPVRAAGEGRVVERRKKGGYGRLVTLEHGSRYRTRYAHLARYARGLSRGDRVERGEVIGYVGNSGLSTGPHLHYEFLVNGQHRNPAEVDLPKADPLPAQHREEFTSHAEPLLSALEGESDDGELRIALLEPEQ